MHLRKNIFRTTAFVLVGAVAVGAVVAVNNLPKEDTTAVAGCMLVPADSARMRVMRPIVLQSR